MSSLMEDLYFDRRIVNPTNVSVQSAFICLLHLANEKGLSFEQEDEEQKAAEINFKINKATSEEHEE